MSTSRYVLAGFKGTGGGVRDEGATGRMLRSKFSGRWIAVAEVDVLLAEVRSKIMYGLRLDAVGGSVDTWSLTRRI